MGTPKPGDDGWRWLRTIALGALICLTVPAPARSASESEVVTTLLAALSGLGDAGETFRGRYDRLAPAVREAFDLPLMARISVGRYWDELASDQREALVDAFSRLTIATYAARFNGQTRIRFEMLGAAPARRGGTIVQTAVVKGSGERVPVNYVLQEDAAGWRVVDVYLKGAVSELATRRAEYTSVIGRNGFAGLLGAIERRVAALGAGAAADD